MVLEIRNEVTVNMLLAECFFANSIFYLAIMIIKLAIMIISFAIMIIQLAISIIC